MPSIRVIANPVSREERAAIALGFTEALRDIIKAPSVEVFFQDQQEVFVNGREEAPHSMAALIMEGPVLPAEEIALICDKLYQCMAERGPNKEMAITFVYHANDLQHVGANGALLANRNS